MQVDSTDEIVNFFLSFQSLGDSKFELLKKVNDSRLGQLVVLQVALVAVLELLEINLGFVVLFTDVEDQAADVADLSPGQCELLFVQKRVDKLVLMDTAIESFDIIVKQVLTCEVIELLSHTHLFKELSHGV